MTYRAIPFYDSCEILTPTIVRDTDGLNKNTVATRTVQCRMTDSTNNLLKNYAGQKDLLNITRVLYLDKTDPITKRDFVLFEGEKYKVQGIYRPRGQASIHHIKIYLEIIKNDG